MPKGVVNKSNELRKLIFHQSDRYNIPLSALCKKLGVSFNTFLSNYANIKDLAKEDGSHLIDDETLILMAEMLGVEVRIVLVIKDEKEFEKKAIEFKKALKDEHEKKISAPEA